MMDVQDLFQYTISKLSRYSIKYEYRAFQSKAIMLDIWYDNNFYVFQFDDNYIGVSEVNDDVGFDTIPDEKFYDATTYKIKLNNMFQFRE